MEEQNQQAQPVNQQVEKRGISTLVGTIIIVMASLILFGGVFAYQYFLVKSQPVVETPQTSTDQTAGWKTYTNGDLGISFKYPPIKELQKLELVKNDNFIPALAGTYLAMPVTEANIKSPFRFVSYSSDFVPFEDIIFNKKQINTDWGAQQFADSMGINRDDVFFVKRAGDKSLLVAYYWNFEESPYLELVVLTPLNDEYPNFEIDIPVSGADEGLLHEYEDDIKEGLGIIAQNILDGRYPDVNRKIETASLIANSINIFADQTAGPAPSGVEGWQTYTNIEYGFEIKYPENLFKEIYKYPINGQQNCKPDYEGAIPSLVLFNTFQDYNPVESGPVTGINIEVICKNLEDLKKVGWPGPGRYGALLGEEDIIIGGKKAYRYVDHIPTTNAGTISNYLELGEDTLQIHISINNSYDKNIYTKSADQILSTFKFTTPMSQWEKENTVPVISSAVPASASVGSQVEISGSGFAGFEGDLNLWIENSNGIKGIIYGDRNNSSDNLIKFILPASVCQTDNSYSGLPCSAMLQLTPGNYKIFVRPWGRESNKVDFVIQ